MKVALLTPWNNAWIPYFEAAVKARGHEFSRLKKPEPGQYDVVLHGWTHGTPIYPGAKNVVFLRRHELFDGGLSKVDWKGVSDLICVNTWIRDVTQQVLRQNGFDTPVHLVYNGTDASRWRFKERGPGKKIGMACHVHPKKNLPLAAQILALLPDGYELHIAGEIQDPCTAEYLNHMGKVLRKKIYLYGQIPAEQLSLWWEQMNYCLSTSISEGNPNNVIEAMAKGIKPIVHSWPGAWDQFPGHLFDTAQQAANMVLSNAYGSKEYREEVEKNFSLANFDKVLDIALA